VFRVHGSQCHGIVNTRVGTLRPRLAASAQAMSKLELDVAAMRRQRTAAPDGLSQAVAKLEMDVAAMGRRVSASESSRSWQTDVSDDKAAQHSIEEGGVLFFFDNTTLPQHHRATVSLFLSLMVSSRAIGRSCDRWSRKALLRLQRSITLRAKGHE